MGKVKRTGTRPSKPTSGQSPDTMTNKERIEAELQILRLRKQDISLASATHKVGKVGKASAKRPVKSKKQLKKIERALAVADKEEAKVEKSSQRAEQRKLRKSLWD